MRRGLGVAAVLSAVAMLVAGVAGPAAAGNPPSSPGGPQWTWEEVQPQAAWGDRAGLQAVELRGRFFVLGGRGPFLGPATTVYNDVWRSDDRGINWTPVTSAAPWAGRAYFQAVTLDGAMFVLGGQDYGTFGSPSRFFNDVWRSTDGANWTQMTAAAPWQGRAGLSAVVNNGAIYVFGGSVNDDTAIPGPAGPPRTYFNDVWRSTDGVTWTQVAAQAPWAPRAGAATVVTHGWIYLLGGEDGFVCNPATTRCPPYFNDVWRSRDGRTWQQVTPAAGWSARPGHQCADAAWEIVCFGGFGLDFLGGNPVDTWASVNGRNWRELQGQPWNATGPQEIKYDFDVIATWEQRAGRWVPAIYTFGGDRETFDFADPENPTRIDNDVWRFAPQVRSERHL